MAFVENPRAVIGGNQAGDYAVRVQSELEAEYQTLTADVSGLLQEAGTLPKEVVDDEIMGVYAKVIKRLRDCTGRIEAYHKASKEPYLRGGQAVDGFFFSLWDKVARRQKASKPGAADILQARLDDYNQRKLAAEQERRRRAAIEEARIAREAQEKAAKEAREAEEARLAADRARKPEIIEQKAAVADTAEVAASASKFEAILADDRAEAAHIATLAKPADIVRTRTDDAMVTMAREGYAEITDITKLDHTVLWAFIKESEIEAALRRWAKITGYRQPMDGASIGFRNKTVVR